MNPWPTCQRKLGKQISSARAIPPQNQRLRKYRRACEKTHPPRTPAMKKTIEDFVSRPKPTPAPKPPPQNQRLRKYRRACESTSPPRTPAMKKTIEYFVSRPKPTTAPMPSHQRGFSVFSKRIVNQAISTHHRKSKEVYWNSVPLNSGSGESATAIAAVAWASRLPPSSRAIRPVTTMATACAQTEKSRKPIRESPKTSRLIRSRRGVSGGEATNPQSRRGGWRRDW